MCFRVCCCLCELALSAGNDRTRQVRTVFVVISYDLYMSAFVQKTTHSVMMRKNLYAVFTQFSGLLELLVG
jgi:hypothetical protein